MKRIMCQNVCTSRCPLFSACIPPAHWMMLTLYILTLMVSWLLPLSCHQPPAIFPFSATCPSSHIISNNYSGLFFTASPTFNTGGIKRFSAWENLPDSWRRSQNDVVVREGGTFCRPIYVVVPIKCVHNGNFLPYMLVWDLNHGISFLYMGVESGGTLAATMCGRGNGTTSALCAALAFQRLLSKIQARYERAGKHESKAESREIQWLGAALKNPKGKSLPPMYIRNGERNREKE